MQNSNKITREKISSYFLITSALIYFIAEFVSAAACPQPYSYTQNFISNLGVKGPSTLFGQAMLSPLSWLMNSGFLLLGIVSFIGIILLPIKAPRLRWSIHILSFLFMIGVTLVGIFHGSQQALQNGTGMFHSLGAFLAFISGNILLILLSSKRLSLISLKRKLIMMGLGIFGLVCCLLYFIFILLSVDNNPIIIIGLIERGAVYPILLGFIYYGNFLNHPTLSGNE